MTRLELLMEKIAAYGVEITPGRISKSFEFLKGINEPIAPMISRKAARHALFKRRFAEVRNRLIKHELSLPIITA
jgi:hypothetical protein